MKTLKVASNSFTQQRKPKVAHIMLLNRLQSINMYCTLSQYETWPEKKVMLIW